MGTDRKPADSQPASEPVIPSSRRPAAAAPGMVAGLQAACTGALAAARELLRETLSREEIRLEAQKNAAGEPGARRELAQLSDRVEVHGRRAEECHAGAAQRVDSALYELEQLRRELEAVIDPTLLVRTAPAVSAPAPSAAQFPVEQPAPAMASPAPRARSAA